MNTGEGACSLNILLVDDEPRVLQGLRRLLRSPGWEVKLAAGGHEALETMGARDTDVIVTDFRMPGMDGVALLEEVRVRHPEVVRIILSGHIDREATWRTTSVAHQYLSKPCEADALREALGRASELRPLPPDPSARRMVGSLGSLPSAPAMWLELERRLTDPEVSTRDVADVISRDIALAAKVLQLVNSAFMGLARKISSVEEAVAYLGIGMVRSLILAPEAFRSFERAGQVANFPGDALSAHGQACSRVARTIMGSSAQRDHAAVAALLQDVGQLVLADGLPDLYEKNLALARTHGIALHIVEAEQLGYTHADVGAYLLRLWGLPEPVVAAVSLSHAPLASPFEPESSPADAARLAHALVQTHGGATEDPTDFVNGEIVREQLSAYIPEVELERWDVLTARAQDDLQGAVL